MGGAPPALTVTLGQRAAPAQPQGSLLGVSQWKRPGRSRLRRPMQRLVASAIASVVVGITLIAVPTLVPFGTHEHEKKSCSHADHGEVDDSEDQYAVCEHRVSVTRTTRCVHQTTRSETARGPDFARIRGPHGRF